MFLKNWVAALAALVICAGAALATPLEAYGRLPTLTDISLSPDGTSIAYVQGNDAKRLVIAQSLATKKLLGAVDITGAKLRALQWADNHILLITTSMTSQPVGIRGNRDEYFLAQSFDVQTGQQHALLERPGDTRNMDTMNVISGVPEPRIIDGHTIVFVHGIYFASDVGYLALFRIDLTANTTRIVSPDHHIHAEDWVVDEAGNIVAESSYYEEGQRWKLAVYHDGIRSDVLDVPAPIETPELEGLSEDGTAVVVNLPKADGTPSYQQISLKGASVGPWQHASTGFGHVMVGLRSGRVTGGTRVTDTTDYVFFDPKADVVWRSVKAAFKDATDVDLASWSDDHTVVLVHVFGPTYGDGYFVVDMNQHKASPVGPAYDGISDIAPVTWIDYHAADGRLIHAYLTLPLGKEAKNLPLIVLPHGGPHSRDEPGFDWLPQALASRGYVVLQPQFRGSDGFGTDLLNAGFGEFGKKMQTDLSDGVRALAAQGMIDPKRVCIVGASYGGYAALAGATLDTGVYRCAVSVAGLSDLHDLLRSWRASSHSEDRNQRFWNRFLGVNDPDDPKLDAISPIKHVDRVSIPILLIHGRDDTVVPFAQSSCMADALRVAKKPFEFVTLNHEDHWLSKGETRLQMLQATVKFLEANNPPN